MVLWYYFFYLPYFLIHVIFEKYKRLNFSSVGKFIQRQIFEKILISETQPLKTLSIFLVQLQSFGFLWFIWKLEVHSERADLHPASMLPLHIDINCLFWKLFKKWAPTRLILTLWHSRSFSFTLPFGAPGRFEENYSFYSISFKYYLSQ